MSSTNVTTYSDTIRDTDQRLLTIFFVVTNLPNNLKGAHSLEATTSAAAVVVLVLMQDLGHALQCKRRTLADLQQLVLAGKLGNTPESLKPFDGLLVNDLRTSTWYAYSRKAQG